MFSIGSLLAILRLLLGRATAVGTSDVLLLLGFGLYLACALAFLGRTLEYDTATGNYLINIRHNLVISYEL